MVRRASAPLSRPSPPDYRQARWWLESCIYDYDSANWALISAGRVAAAWPPDWHVEELIEELRAVLLASCIELRRRSIDRCENIREGLLAHFIILEHDRERLAQRGIDVTAYVTARL